MQTYIYAIHYNGFIIENIPILSTRDRITLKNLTVGNNFDLTFMEPMEISDDATTSIICKSDDLDHSASNINSQCYRKIRKCLIHWRKWTKDQNIKTNISLEIDKLQVNMNRITSLAQNNMNIMVLKNLKQFNKLLGTINTVSDFPDIFFNRLRWGKLIGTQPTFWARRTRKITPGAKLIQSGRPTILENCSKHKKKSKIRCFGTNITNNMPYTKSH